MAKIAWVRITVAAFLAAFLVSCGGGGGGGGGDAPAGPSSRSIGGGGVKGPLANAIVTVYRFDAAQPGFKGSVAGTGATNAAAAITGLSLPLPLSPPYIMEFTSDAGTTDITTGLAPVIRTVRTVITEALLNTGEQIYATPLTTIATDIAVVNAADTNGTPGIQADEFEAALAAGAAQVVSTLGFGMGSSVDIFDTPPLVDSTTDTTEEQSGVAAYRAAVEAVTAIVFQIDQQTTGGDADDVLTELAADLADGGGIDGSAGSEINSNTLQVLEQDPATLIIPNTTRTVADVQAILVSETATTGTTTSTTELDTGGSITTKTEPAETDPDIDSDGVLNADDAYPNDATSDTDTDGDGAPDVAWTDGTRTSIDSARSDADDDNDGWSDTADDYPLDNTRFLDPALDRDSDTVPNGNDNCPVIPNLDQVDTDGDGRGDACSNDNDGDGIDDGADNCPLIANPGQEDLDGDTAGDVCDANIDGDAADNASDAFPLDPAETTDTDGDGLGDSIADSDDDNDRVSDAADTGVAPPGSPSAGVACSLLRDCDGDGVLDNVDIAPTDPASSVNYAPVANADSASADEDSATFAIAVTANDTDDDGNPADSVGLVSVGAFDSALGTAIVNGNNIDYTPAPNASGSDTFVYTVTDGLVTSSGSVTVTINPVNDAPVAVDDAATTNEDTAVTTGNVLLNDTDIEGDLLSVVPGNPTATNGTVVNHGDGTFTYTPNPNSDLDDSFAYTVSDGNGGLDGGIVFITVNPVNDPPVGGDDSLTTNEDTAGTTGNVLANDSDGGDGGALSVAAFDAVSVQGGSVSDSGGGTFTYTPAADFSGSDSFTYTLSDGSDTDVVIVNVTVDPVNDAPVAIDDAATTNEDTAVTTGNVLLNDTDIEGDTLSVVPGNPTATNGTVVNHGDGTFTYSPNANFNGGDSFAYTVSDGNGGLDGGIVLITVNPINDAPVGGDDSLTTNEDTAGTTGDVLLNDTDGGDGGALSITAADTTSVNGGSVVNNGNNTFTYTPAADFNGSDSFTYTLSDGSDTDVVTVNVTVDPVNDAPVGNADAANAAVLAATVVDVLANDTDVDGDTLSVTGVTQGSLGSTVVISNGGSTVTFTDVNNIGGTETFTYDVFDGNTTVSGITVTMTVSANAPPVATDDAATTDEDTAVTTVNVLANDTDGGDGGALSIAAADTASVNGGTVADNGNGTFTYTPAADFFGSDSFTYTLSDTFGTDIGTVNITVNPVNDVPVAVDDVGSLTTNEDTAGITGDVLANDSDVDVGDTLFVFAFDATSANGGSVTDNGNGTFTYTPAPNFNGNDSFTYTVSDGSDTAIATVGVVVDPINDDPVAADDAESVTVDNVLLTADVLVNDSDVDGDTLSVAAGDPTATNGSVVNNGNGTFTYTPNTGFVGGDSFVYTVIDGNGGSDTGTVTITVNPLGTPAVMDTLLDPVQGGGVGALDSFTEGLVQFEYWKDEYDPVSGRLLFSDLAYDYSTQTFVDSRGPEDLWLTPIGTWEQPTSFDVITTNDGDGSMIAQATTPSGAAGSFRLRASTRDISGELISAYVDGNWQNQMLNPAATFGAGALEVTSYSFEALADTYFLTVETGCEFENPTRWATLGSANCNGVNLDVTGNTDTNYATSLAQIQSVSPWPDSDSFDISGLIAISMSFNGLDNTLLLAELVTGGNTVNYWVRDFSAATGADHMTLALSVPNGYQTLTVVGVDIIRVDVPPSLLSLFPDLAEDPLQQIFAVESGFVRGGVVSEAGALEVDTGILNGIALDQVLANFSPPAAPDFTGTWVADAPTASGDRPLFHYFANGYYEASGTCDNDGTQGMEYGTLVINGDGSFIATPSVNTRGVCSLPSLASAGATLTVSGDTLTVTIPGFPDTTATRLRGTPERLVGSWLLGDITVGGDGGHVMLTFLDDSTFSLSEDCSNDFVIGMEYGTYSWDQGVTNNLSGSVSIDTIGDCGLNETSTGSTLPGDWAFTVAGDTLTITFPDTSTVNFTRHSPAPVITPPIAYETVLGTLPTTAYYVWYDAFTDFIWKITQLDFAADGSYVRTPPDTNGDPTGTPSGHRYQVINGIVYLSGGPWYLQALSVDPVNGAYRECYKGSYAGLADCGPLDNEWVFVDDLAAATAFKNSLNTTSAFSGAAVDASVVFAGGGLGGIELVDYEPTPGNFVDTPVYFTVEVSGSSVTDREFLLIDGAWTETTDYFDIALTPAGWNGAVDWRFDTVPTPPGTTAILQNVEGGSPLQQLTVSFSEMDITGQNLLPFVQNELVNWMTNGSFSAGARVYETNINVDLDYYLISDWGTNCDDGFGGNFNGNCNAAGVRTFDRATGNLLSFASATDTSFLNVNTAGVEIGWSPTTTLLGVFTNVPSGGPAGQFVLELWEIDFSTGFSATNTGATGVWESRTISGEQLIFYDVPQAYRDAYEINLEAPAFLSFFNGYVRFGEQEDEAGASFTEYLFNPTALQDIRNSITPP